MRRSAKGDAEVAMGDAKEVPSLITPSILHSLPPCGIVVKPLFFDAKGIQSGIRRGMRRGQQRGMRGGCDGDAKGIEKGDAKRVQRGCEGGCEGG